VLVPTLLSLIWLCLFGGTALHIELFDSSAGLARTVSQDMTLALYRTLDLMDVGIWTWPAGALATALITTWFVTSADSMTLVVCTILSLGNPHPPRRHRIFWGATVGVVAAALLLAGGLQALQTASIVAALPFSVVMLIMAAALFRSLAQESSESTR
jgi:choline/glycine/proline betaine transport protein